MIDRTQIAKKLEGNGLVESILKLDTKWIDYVVLLGLLVLMVVLIVETRDFSRWAAQRTPLVVFSAIIVLILLELARQAGLIGWGGESEENPLSSLTDNFDEEVGEGEGESQHVSLFERRLGLVKILTWILGLFAAVYLLGLLPGSLVFLLAFYYLEAQVGLVKTLVISGLVFLFAWAVFEGLLGARLYEGTFELGEYFYYRFDFI